LNNRLRSVAVSVRIGHPFEGTPEVRRLGFANASDDQVRIGWDIQDIWAALTSPLSQSDVDGWEREGAGLHDSAATVSDENLDVP
jgi:hypothetical protein